MRKYLCPYDKTYTTGKGPEFCKGVKTWEEERGKLKEQTPRAPSEFTGSAEGTVDALFAVIWGVLGILLAAVNSNIVAAMFVVVILVWMLNNQSSKELIQTQRDYIGTLEKALKEM